MIAYLHGTLAVKSTDAIVIDVNQVGYEVEISTQTYQQLPDEGTALKLLIYHHFTDNNQRLFGFFTADEKELFELLITVKGVGPKLGLTILSGLPADQIIAAILQEEKNTLTQITGIGKKTAQRMILELSDKMKKAGIAVSTSNAPGLDDDTRQEALSALQSLGIGKKDAQKAVQAAASSFDGPPRVEQLVKKALSRVNS